MTDTVEILKDGEVVPDTMYKVIVVGEASVGKTCLLVRAVDDKFLSNYEVTIGADSRNFITKIDSKIVQLQIWDTAGCEKYRSMIRVFFAGSNSALLTYDITSKESFAALDYWLDIIRQATTSDVKIVLVGNKKDEEEKREVSYEMGNEFAKNSELFAFVETSAKTGEGIKEILIKLAKSLLSSDQNAKEENIHLENDSNDDGGCC